jgi:hypothetical protein
MTAMALSYNDKVFDTVNCRVRMSSGIANNSISRELFLDTIRKFDYSNWPSEIALGWE